MSNQLTERLNAILPKITSPDFLGGQKIGGEVPFHVFDYPAEDELRIREHLTFLIDKLPKQAPDLKVAHVNLFDFLIDYIKGRGYFEKSLEKERALGSAKAVKSIKSIASAEKLADHFNNVIMGNQPDLVLVSGVGSSYPIIRTHELLNNLHKHMGLTPLVMFYPGVYDKITLKLFGKASLAFDSSSTDRKRKARYYRAFRLID
ncbi:DUF1788 domain-containing protein [Gimesia maris]|uniref:DUF1788 domain-containing protein n=1 Tax=Gimesia maris TaxID=122 RepID=UPI003A928FE6